MVTLKMFGNLKTILAVSEHRIDVDGKGRTVGHVLESLTRQYGQQLRQELFDSDGKIKSGYTILVNGRNVASLSGARALCREMPFFHARLGILI